MCRRSSYGLRDIPCTLWPIDSDKFNIWEIFHRRGIPWILEMKILAILFALMLCGGLTGCNQPAPRPRWGRLPAGNIRKVNMLRGVSLRGMLSLRGEEKGAANNTLATRSFF